jgi:flagellar biosynthesis/type III secretory pathway M-ring protein FliF/YscJ
MNSNLNKPNQANVVNSQVQQLQDVMRDNIQKAVKRGEQLERLEERTDYLDASANQFKTTSNKTKQKFFLKNLKWTILLAVVIILIIAMIILSIYLSFRNK